MTTITEQTTLAELAVERARLGVSTMMLTQNPDLKGRPGRMCIAYGPGFDVVSGVGATEAEAIGAAFREIVAHAFAAEHTCCGHAFPFSRMSDRTETILCDLQKDHGGDSHSGIDTRQRRVWLHMSGGAPVRVSWQGEDPGLVPVAAPVAAPAVVSSTSQRDVAADLSSRRSSRPRTAVLSASAIVVTCPSCHTPQPAWPSGYWAARTASSGMPSTLDWAPPELRAASEGDQHGADGCDCVHCGVRLILDPGYMRLAEGK